MEFQIHIFIHAVIELSNNHNNNPRVSLWTTKISKNKLFFRLLVMISRCFWVLATIGAVGKIFHKIESKIKAVRKKFSQNSVPILDQIHKPHSPSSRMHLIHNPHITSRQTWKVIWYGVCTNHIEAVCTPANRRTTYHNVMRWIFQISRC